MNVATTVYVAWIANMDLTPRWRSYILFREELSSNICLSMALCKQKNTLSSLLVMHLTFVIFIFFGCFDFPDGPSEKETKLKLIEKSLCLLLWKCWKPLSTRSKVVEVEIVSIHSLISKFWWFLSFLCTTCNSMAFLSKFVAQNIHPYQKEISKPFVVGTLCAELMKRTD